MNELVPSKERVVEAISFLNGQDAQARRSKVNLKTSLAIETIESFGKKEGFPGELIIDLVDLGCSGKYNETTSSKVIKSMIPQDTVPSLAVLKVVSWICTNTLSTNYQALLLRWIIVVYKLIDDLSYLHSLYGILFLFLESDALCPHACYLLAYLTKQYDVKHFRIKKLLNLQNRVGSQAHLSGLLSVYKMFCPHLVSMATPSNKFWFRNRDKSWCDAVAKVQANRNSKIPPEILFLHVREPSHSVSKRRRLVGTDVPLLNKVQCVTEVHDMQNNVVVVELNSFEDLLENIDTIQLPSQISSILESPFLQHVLCCNPSHVALQRLNFWLYQSLQQGFLQEECSTIDPANISMLQSLIQLTTFLQESLPASETWLVQYLHSWNNEDYRTLILELIEHISLIPFVRLNEQVLEPLRRFFFTSSVYIKSQILCCFTDLLRNFAAVELPRAQKLLGETHNTSNRSSIFVGEQKAFNGDPLQTLYDFIHYVDRMCVIAMQKETDHPLLQHCVLNFFELVSVLHTEFNIPFVVIPSPAIVYRLFFADNTMACSRICQIIVNYRDTFISLKNYEKDQSCSSSIPKSAASIQTLNRYILDISNSLWRNKAFLDTDKSLCFSIPWVHSDNLDVRHTNERFSLYQHAAFVGFAWTFLQQTQPKDVTLNPSLIKGNVRQVYLEYLKQMKIYGVITFLETFIRQKK